ncbi:MAG: hypothetical protein AAFO97_14660 [Pseudomonadota bacterium]
MLTAVKATVGISTGVLTYMAAVDVAASLSPLAAVFDADALVVAIHGALGGSARWLFLREPWRDGLRLMLLGAVLAAGVGNLWRLLVGQWFSDVPESVWTQPETAYSGAFLVGLGAVTFMGRFIDEAKGEGDDDER